MLEYPICSLYRNFHFLVNFIKRLSSGSGFPATTTIVAGKPLLQSHSYKAAPGLHFLWERLSASKIVAKSHSHNHNAKLVNGREIYFQKAGSRLKASPTIYQSISTSSCSNGISVAGNVFTVTAIFALSSSRIPLTTIVFCCRSS